MRGLREEDMHRLLARVEVTFRREKRIDHRDRVLGFVADDGNHVLPVLTRQPVRVRCEPPRQLAHVESLGAAGRTENLTSLASVRAMLTNRSAPPATVTPVLIYPDVRAAVAWLDSAFGFKERVRIGDAHRAQLRVGSDGSVVVADVRRDQVAPSEGVVTQIVKVRVPDVDAAFARARDFGARVLDEPQTSEYGERSCVLEDLGGHRWELTQTVRDVEPEEWGGVTVAPW